MKLKKLEGRLKFSEKIEIKPTIWGSLLGEESADIIGLYSHKEVCFPLTEEELRLKWKKEGSAAEYQARYGGDTSKSSGNGYGGYSEYSSGSDGYYNWDGGFYE